MFNIGPGKDYVTFHFPNEGQEALVPANLLEKSAVIQQWLSKSHDNALVISHIGATTFDNLTAFLAKPSAHHNAPELSDMIKAAQHLGLHDAEKDLQKLFKDTLLKKPAPVEELNKDNTPLRESPPAA